MASRMIGRTSCPECGFSAAHVKQSDKCLYRYCPECQSQHHARTERQRADLMQKTRPVEGSPTPTGEQAPEPTPTPTASAPTPGKPTATPTPAPAPAPAAPKRRGLWA